jgi:hypothetical protein
LQKTQSLQQEFHYRFSLRFLLFSGENFKSKILPQIRYILFSLTFSIHFSDANSHPFMFASSQRDAPHRSGTRGRLGKY